MALDATPLAGRTAVISGATGGIGAATARLFAEATCRPWVNAVAAACAWFATRADQPR